MAYANKKYVIHSKSDDYDKAIEAEIFGSGFISLSEVSRPKRLQGEARIDVILIDPDDIDALDESVREAKRRRNASRRRRKRKLAKEKELV